MSSKTQINNIALSRIGVSKQLSNVDTDTSREAIVARVLFDDDVLFTLRDFPWPFATSYADLALVGGTAAAAVNRDWQYSYRYPSDCVFVRRVVVDGAGGRNNPNPPPYRVGRDSQGKLIFTNEAEAQIEYTSTISDPAEFDSMFVSMLAWKLGAGMSPSLSRIKGMAEQCMQMYEIEKTKAQSRALNEGQQETQIESEFIRSRE